MYNMRYQIRWTMKITISKKKKRRKRRRRRGRRRWKINHQLSLTCHCCLVESGETAEGGTWSHVLLISAILCRRRAGGFKVEAAPLHLPSYRLQVPAGFQSLPVNTDHLIYNCFIWLHPEPPGFNRFQTDDLQWVRRGRDESDAGEERGRRVGWSDRHLPAIPITPHSGMIHE